MPRKKRSHDKLINEITQSAAYEFGGRRYIVTPYFKKNGVETLGSLILKMMKNDIENNRL